MKKRAAIQERSKRTGGAVGEDVDEQPAVRRAASAAMRVQQRLPVAHVLEHLDRDDPVEAALRGERVDVGGDDLELSAVRRGSPR